MIKLGTVTLNENIYLDPDPKNLEKISYSEKRTMGGRVVLTANPVICGQELRLVDQSEYGVFKGYEIDALAAYYEAGSEVVLQHHTGSWRVVITGFDVDPADGECDPNSESDYTGEIIMKITEWL